MSYKVEIIERKDPIEQLEASKSSIKDLFNDLFNERKGFKYQITVKFFLKKYKHNGEIEFAPVYSNALTKTVINQRFKLENYFQEILYINLSVELRSPRKGLINIKSKDQKCFLCCHIRHKYPWKEHPERILKIGKKNAEKLDYDEIDFPV